MHIKPRICCGQGVIFVGVDVTHASHYTSVLHVCIRVTYTYAYMQPDLILSNALTDMAYEYGRDWSLHGAARRGWQFARPEGRSS
jgi:hypothetical protein